MKCEYCNKLYSNKQNLVRHQKTDSCIIVQNLQQKLNDALSEIETLKQDNIKLRTRLEVYSEQKQEFKQHEIETLRQDNIKLQTRLELYSEQKPSININSTTTNNNISNTKIINQLQVFDLNKTAITKIAREHFTLDYLKEENKGVAKFTINHVIKDSNGNPNYICTDLSRKTAKYKSVDNNIVTDVGMENLSDTVYNSIKNKVTNLVMTNRLNEQEERPLHENPYYINQQNLDKTSPDFSNQIAKAVYLKNIQN